MCECVSLEADLVIGVQWSEAEREAISVLLQTLYDDHGITASEKKNMAVSRSGYSQMYM